MRNRSLTVFTAAVGLLFTSIPLSGHHASAVFDTGKKVTLTGSVVEWFWANPHCLLRFDVKDAAGQVANWVGETQAPPNMIPRGWTRQSFKVGDEITITLEPAKSGRTVRADPDRPAPERQNVVGHRRLRLPGDRCRTRIQSRTDLHGEASHDEACCH